MSHIGIDISNNNGNLQLDNVVKNGVEFIYVKATEGTTFKDNKMNDFYNQCKNLGAKVGAYHFLVGTSSPETQADNFYNTIKNYSWDLVPMLDIEKNFDGLCNYILRFINRFRQLSDMELGIYSYTGFIPYLNSIQSYIKDMKLWEANYNGKPWNLKDTFFTNRVGHQYSETGSFADFTGDINVFTDGVLMDSTKPGEWILKDGRWWYRYTDGTYPVDCWLKIKNKWYLFDTEGWMKYSWQSDNGNWYYLGDSDDGSMKTGWVLVDGKWYYLDETGAMKTGWVKVNNTWFYMNEKGEMQTGWIKYQGDDYLLDSEGRMYQDCEAYGYKFDKNGKAIKL